MGLLSGKNGIIVGASQGIGLGIAKKFVQEGGNIVMTARNLEKLEAACAENRGSTRQSISRTDRNFFIKTSSFGGMQSVYHIFSDLSRKNV